MKVLLSLNQPPLLHWDRKLSELCEPADPDTLLGHTVRRAGAARAHSSSSSRSPIPLISALKQIWCLRLWLYTNVSLPCSGEL
uniref:Uncharacterized protein n=1 Tax=Meleagris gallopavo TaxID=9103 RepID=A0A803Y7U3_MELGA